jgi:hypothetical protein
MPKAATVPKPSYSQVWPVRNMTGSAHKVGAAGWIRSVGKTWLGNGLAEGTIGARAAGLLVPGVLWTFCYWLYRRKVFIRI